MLPTVRRSPFSDEPRLRGMCPKSGVRSDHVDEGGLGEPNDGEAPGAPRPTNKLILLSIERLLEGLTGLRRGWSVQHLSWR